MKTTAQTIPAVARRRSRRAFSILEVMTSASVMTLVFTSTLTVLQRGYQSIDTARYQTLAGQILQSQVEKLRLLTWTQLVTGTTSYPAAKTFTSFTPDPGLISSAQVGNFYSCTQSIVDDPTFANMEDITLTAYWTGTDGMKRSRTYYTQYAQNGISDIFYTANTQ